jgi:hypothetical protein
MDCPNVTVAEKHEREQRVSRVGLCFSQDTPLAVSAATIVLGVNHVLFSSTNTSRTAVGQSPPLGVTQSQGLAIIRFIWRTGGYRLLWHKILRSRIY